MKLTLLKELNAQDGAIGGDIPPTHPEVMADTNARPEPAPEMKTADKLSEIQKIVLIKAVLAQPAYDEQGNQIEGFKQVDLKGEQEVAAIKELERMGILGTNGEAEVVQLTAKALGSLKQEGMLTPEAEVVQHPHELSMEHLTDDAHQLVDEINNKKGDGLAQDKTGAGQTANNPAGAAPGLPGAGGLGASGGGGLPMTASFKNYLLQDPKYSFLAEKLRPVGTARRRFPGTALERKWWTELVTILGGEKLEYALNRGYDFRLAFDEGRSPENVRQEIKALQL